MAFLDEALFLTFLHKKAPFQMSKVVKEAKFITNWGYICIEKRSYIFVWAPEVPDLRVRKR